ncbi:MAG: DEAD/DEAH box helicase [Candidatus Lokiarchaeota archaeon]|nr:DEAD/DEAH box helicase [Candidatus Lokiarchaeota archaeon]
MVEEPESKEIIPRDYQINARDQIVSMLEDGEKRVFLVLMPTGMGKTLISAITVDILIEKEILKKEDKILFLVQDRKLKYQLYEMAKSYGLAQHGHLFLLDEGNKLPAQMSRQHAELSRFIFATPILLMNAVVGKTQKIKRETLDNIKLVIIDEILDVFAQSYGKKRPRGETIEYIEKKYGNGRTFKQIVQDLINEFKTTQQDDDEFQIDEAKVENYLIKEFSAKEYRLNMKFEPILNLLGLLNPNSEKIIIGLTASLSQDSKIDLLKRNLGSEEIVTEIHPVGEEFEDYKPAYDLKQIRVYDDWISEIDNIIQDIKQAMLLKLHKVYNKLFGRKRIPYDRILLFIGDLLGKKSLQQRLIDNLKLETKKKMTKQEESDLIKPILSNASAYLLMTVARQRLLENTLQSFFKFIERINNQTLLSNEQFQKIKEKISEKMKEVKETEDYIGEKEKRLLFWTNKLVNEDKNILVLCRFVDMTKHLARLMDEKGIPSTFVHGKMDGAAQHNQIQLFKRGDVKILFASERLIEKGTDLPEADVAIYYGTTVSLERYEQSLGRIRSNVQNVKTSYTLSYNLTVENEKSLKRDTLFLELMGKKLSNVIKE